MMTYWLLGQKRSSEISLSTNSDSFDRADLPGELTHAARSAYTVPLNVLSKMDTESRMTARIAPQTASLTTVIDMKMLQKEGEKVESPEISGEKKMETVWGILFFWPKQRRTSGILRIQYL